MDYEQARQNMLEQQIRTWEVLDQTVLDLIANTPREAFIPDKYKDLALADTRIPLGHDQVTLTPKTEARILQSLNIQPTDKILEIGTGCGYLTVLLAKLGKSVVSLDIIAEFTQKAREKLDRLGIHNVEFITEDGLAGWEKQAPYDVIVYTGSVPSLNADVHEQLTVGGRLLAIIGESPIMEVTRITRVSAQDWIAEVLFETDIPPLVGAKAVEKFEL